MSKQDKATTERNSKTLRELVKRPENKVCADCKRNDPSGVFLCIRCSGIHRGMGTHISKVKSVDLDVWTPEQMDSIQKWGNYRANLFWEAHLKRGHIPPDHKMESFIRSKYETRRWAMEGPIPLDPLILEKAARLDEEEAAAVAAAEAETVTPQAQQVASPPVATHTRQPSAGITRQPQTHQLLSANYTTQQSSAAARAQPVSANLTPAAPPPQAQKASDDLFSLDFHAPQAPSANFAAAEPQQRKDVKQDILSLFNTSSAPAAQVGMGQFNVAPAAPTQANTWGASPPVVSMAGNTGVSAWGVGSGWGAPVPPAQPNVWTNPSASQHQQPNFLTSSNDIWGNGSSGTSSGQPDLFGSSFTAHSGVATKKNDAFGDLWGGFK